VGGEGVFFIGAVFDEGVADAIYDDRVLIGYLKGEGVYAAAVIVSGGEEVGSFWEVGEGGAGGREGGAAEGLPGVGIGWGAAGKGDLDFAVGSAWAGYRFDRGALEFEGIGLGEGNLDFAAVRGIGGVPDLDDVSTG
jgi:hypothetical protein